MLFAVFQLMMEQLHFNSYFAAVVLQSEHIAEPSFLFILPLHMRRGMAGHAERYLDMVLYAGITAPAPEVNLMQSAGR